MILTAIKKLNKKKDDGDKGFYSDHIIMSTHRFKVLRLLLINTLTRGYNADNLLVSIIASISKDLISSMNISDNYKEISLCSALCKLIDLRFLYRKYSVYLKISDMQFAFKSNHDTALCTATLKVKCHTILIEAQMDILVC